MSSKIQICNSALSLLGVDEPILSLDDDKKVARLCKINFELVRDELLEDHYWNFALKRKELAKLSSGPIFDFRNAFQIPSDVVRIRKINGRPNIMYKVEGNKLLTNESKVMIQYISRETDVSLYSPSFKEALAFSLAAKLAYSIVQSSTHMERLQNAAMEKLRNARSLDGQVDMPDDFVDDIFLDARMGTGGFGGRIDSNNPLQWPDPDLPED